MKSPQMLENAIRQAGGRILQGTAADDGFHFVAYCQGVNLFCIASWGGRWDHVSVHVYMGGEMTRIPSWEEMCFIKDLCWLAEECVVQFHPPKSQYKNDHPHVLHLWKSQTKAMPRPPREFV